VLLVAACQGTPSPSGASEPTVTEPPLAAAGEAYVVTILNDDRPFFDVRVDAVAPTGPSRLIATLTDVHPAGWTEADPIYDMPLVVGPTRRLLVVAERGGGVNPGDTRTILFDLSGGMPPVEIEGAINRPRWSPDGRLAEISDQPETIDPLTGVRTAIAHANDVEVMPAWLADGSGWIAVRYGEDEPTIGWLSTSGVFTAGPATAFQVTGRERFTGATGGRLEYAVSDGATESEVVIAERREDLPGACQCLIWARKVDPGDDPGFGEADWDMNGRGIWLVFSKDERRWLSHVAPPLVDTPVADLPPGVEWSIAGISSDDRWIVLASTEGGILVLVDTAAGAAREIARAFGDDDPPRFAGWVR
jgi:hypothetical protein